MKWVKCVYTINKDILTPNKIYSVIKTSNHNFGTSKGGGIEEIVTYVTLLNNNGDENTYTMIDNHNNAWFINADAEVRDNKLNELGI